MASSPTFESVMRYLPEEEKISGLRKDLVHLVIILQDLINWIRMTVAHMEKQRCLIQQADNLEHFIRRPKWPRLQVFGHTLEAYRCRSSCSRCLLLQTDRCVSGIARGPQLIITEFQIIILYISG